MSKTKNLFFYLSFIPVLGIVAGSALLLQSNPQYDDVYFGLDEDDDHLEVISPMSCVYRGKLKFDSATEDSLKKYQKVLQ